MEWYAQESCLRKLIETDHSTAAKATAEADVPGSADQIYAEITVTDSEGSTARTSCQSRVEGYEREGESWVNITNGMDYVRLGDPVSASWEISGGPHTISNVRFRWVTEYQDEHGTMQEMTDWTNAGNSLTGSSTYTPAKAGLASMVLAFDAENGWACESASFDRIQVLDTGEDPVTATIGITPTNPKAGEPFTITWETGGTSPDAEIRVEWEISDESGSSSRMIDPAQTQGSQQLTADKAGHLRASIEVRENGKGLHVSKHVQAEITEQSGITLEVSPENPKLGEPVTIRWSISRPSYQSADLSVMLQTRNLVKYLPVEADLNTNKTGSVTFTPEEGDSLEASVSLRTAARYYEETTGPIALQGSWEAPEPIQVTTAWQVQPGDAENECCILADYTVTGGTGRYKMISARLARYSQDRTDMMYERMTDSVSGQMTFVPGSSGEYGLVFHVQDASGWEYRESAWTVSEKVTMTCDPSPLGLHFYQGLPREIVPGMDNSICWDVTGGDSEEKTTFVYMETDDGITLDSGFYTGYTNKRHIPTEAIGSESKYVIITLEPEDNTSTAEATTLSFPVKRLRNILVLPRGLKEIEAEAFLNAAADGVDIPDTVVNIGTDAFPRSAILIVGSGSDAETWAKENRYSYRTR